MHPVSLHPKNQDSRMTDVQQFVANIKVEDATSYEDLVEAALLNDRTLNAAKLFITMVPVLAVYPFLQKYFTKGIVVGAVKG